MSTVARPKTQAPNPAAAISGATLLVVSRDDLRVLLEELRAEYEAEPQPSLLTDESCAQLLGVSTATLRRRLIDEGIPVLHIGDCRRYEREAVLAWARSRTVTP